MGRKENRKQINAEVSPRNYEELEEAARRKYGTVRGTRARFIRDAIAAAVAAQGVEWSQDIEKRAAWKSGKDKGSE